MLLDQLQPPCEQVEPRVAGSSVVPEPGHDKLSADCMVFDLLRSKPFGVEQDAECVVSAIAGAACPGDVYGVSYLPFIG